MNGKNGSFGQNSEPKQQQTLQRGTNSAQLDDT